MYFCIKGGIIINPPSQNDEELMKQFSELPIVDHDFLLGTDIPAHPPELPAIEIKTNPDIVPASPVIAKSEAKPDITPETAPEPPVIPETKAESVTASVPDLPKPPVKAETAVQPAAALTAAEAPPVPVIKPLRLSEAPIEDHDFPLETDEPVKTVEPVSTSTAKPDTAPEAVVEPPVVPEAKPVTVPAPDTEPAAVPAAPEAEAKPDNIPETAAEPPVIPETKAESVTASVPDQPEPPVKTEDAVEPAAALTADEAPPVPVTKPFRLSETPIEDHDFPLETDEPVKPIADASAPKHAMGHGIHKAPQKQTTLDAGSIPKFKNKLVKPPVYMPAHTADGERLFVVDMVQFKQQMLPEGFPATTVWGYGGLTMDPETYCPTYVQSSPGPTFEAIRNVPIKVKWVNKLQGPHLFAVDPTLHWANPNNMPMHPPMPWPDFPPGFPEAQSPVPAVTHLHGGEVPSIFDGHPEAWFTHDGKKGPAFVTNLYNYPNTQPPTTLWYHDHALGITRLNVYAGLAGFYLLRDGDELYNKRYLPKGKYEIPLVIQDRSFNPDGSLAFTTVGVNPDIHPYWDPEFFGDVILVNGKVWPNLDVERRQYRFRVLNGSNARFYNLRFSNGMTFTQIGSDGGFLPEPVKLTSLLLAPAERADLLVDFSGVMPGTHVTLTNDANAPYPDGNPVDPNTTGQILRFSVPAHTPAPVCPPPLPKKLNVIPCLKPNAPQRILTLNEVQGENGPVVVLLNGQHWDAPVSENPIVGSTEEWVIANLTMDTHPIHLHLVQFLLKDRQDFDADAYLTKWTLINGNPPLNHRTYEIPVEKYLIGCPIPPAPNETGWKDTVRMNPMQVTRILVRFAPQDVKTSLPHINRFPFDPSCGPGYVWHCHILDHEDNDMMRPYIVRP
jgi:spore coat protein A